MTVCTNPHCLNPRHEHALPLSPLQKVVFGACPQDLARWCVLMGAKALRGGDGETARSAVESALMALARPGGADRRLSLALCEAGAALLKGHDRLAFIALARLVLERQDAVNEIEARLDAADRATEEAAAA